MRFRAFFLANVFGQIGGAVSLAYFGSGIDTQDTLFRIIVVVTLIGFPCLWVLLRLQQRRKTVSS